MDLAAALTMTKARHNLGLTREFYSCDAFTPPNAPQSLSELGTRMTQPAAIENQRPAASAKRVLLVEDDRSVRRFLEVTLQRSGYQVITAADGLEAIKLALSSQIDVVITDAIMPYLSGQELASFLRQNPKLGSIPIVLLTGEQNRQSAVSRDESIDAFLIKPVKAEELADCLASLLRKKD
jgi:CheY-like chemotaxis protein